MPFATLTSRWRSVAVIVLPLTFVAAACSRTGSRAVVPAADNEVWVASTCDPESPDTTGWTRHRFSDLSIAIPPGYTVSNTSSRAVQFRRGTGSLALSIKTSVRIADLHARPDRTKHEKACPVMMGGYPSEILSTWYGQTFTVWVEWDGSSFWPAGDWRRSLGAYVTSSRLQDARLLRRALWTVRADKGVSR